MSQGKVGVGLRSLLGFLSLPLSGLTLMSPTFVGLNSSGVSGLATGGLSTADTGGLSTVVGGLSVATTGGLSTGGLPTTGGLSTLGTSLATRSKRTVSSRSKVNERA